jgi:hypothetical protein
MPKSLGDSRDSLEGYLRDLDTRLGRQERHTHNLGADEVWIGSVPPTDPYLELWYDPTGDTLAGGAVAGRRGPAGPAGPPGAEGPAGDPGPEGPGWPIVVKTTAPVAADYGETTIPVNAVWIVAP